MYRKFTADDLFNGHRLLGSGQVLITTPEGRVVDIQPLAGAGEDIQVLKGILTPGFINAHCHLELSHLQGLIPEKTGLVDFVLQLMRGRGSDSERIQSAIAAAEAAMYQAGIVAVGDICNTADTLPQKQLLKLRYHNFIEASGFVPAGAAARFSNMLQLYRQFKTVLPASSLVPHAPYSVCQPLLAMINELGCSVTTFHNQEVPAENEFFQYGTGDLLRLYDELNIDLSFYQPPGTRSLPAFLPGLNRFESLILVHNVSTNNADLASLEGIVNHQSPIVNEGDSFNIQHSTFNIPGSSRHRPTVNHQPSTINRQLISLCLCPNANRYISGLLPDVPMLQQSGLNIVLGTDSLASNHQLSILEEMKTLQRHFPALGVDQLLQWATLNGALALQMDQELGSFEPGKAPGVVLISGMEGERFSDASVVKRLL